LIPCGIGRAGPTTELTPERKQQIEEEESRRAAEEQYRAQVRRRRFYQGVCPYSLTRGLLLILGLFILVYALGFGYHVWQQGHDSVLQAERESIEVLRESGAQYDRLAARAHERRMEEYELRFGKAARLKLEEKERHDDAIR
jgi:uncharacterized protein HemX